ncbi:MAG: biotin transporter BioY [Thermodesulfobacteriota bacterium]|nr:biotin transporter BioY [Thermodesulfobacteriota bacterium]
MARKISTRGMTYAATFGAMTAIGAYIIIPLPPVPITLQTFVMYLAASLLGRRLGPLSQTVYILLGIIGLPVFAGGKAGLGVLIGPTGGYLIGFIIGAYIIGRMIESRKHSGYVWIALSLITATVVIYICGVAQLSVVARLSMGKAITVGVLPFLIGDAIKIVAATLLIVRIKSRAQIKKISND